MLILAIDTSSSVGSVALIKDQSVLGEQTSQNQKSHSEFVNFAIENLLTTHKLNIDDLTLLSTSIGPGSFTGLRVSCAVIKSLSLILNLKIFTLDSLQMIFENFYEVNHSNNAFYVIANNAYKNQVFASIWQGPDKILGPQLFNIRDFEIETLNQIKESPFYLTGDGYSTYEAQFSNAFGRNIIRPKQTSSKSLAATLGLCAFHSKNTTQTFDWKSLHPLYLKASEAEVNKAKKNI